MGELTMGRLAGPTTWADFADALALAFDGRMVTEHALPDPLDDLLAAVACTTAEEQLVAADRARDVWAPLAPRGAVDADDAEAIVLAAVLPLHGAELGRAVRVADYWAVSISVAGQVPVGGLGP